MTTERDVKIVQWTRQGAASNPPETAVWEDQVWWGYWQHVGSDDVNPPDALFRTEDEAYAFGKLVGKVHDWCVLPVVLKIESRDNLGVPK